MRPMAARKLEVIAVPDRPTLVTRRPVDAPREDVFDAFTMPELVRRWMGPHSHTWVVCESDLRVGGRYRWVHRAPDGKEYAVRGEYDEIARPERMVRTLVSDAFPDDEALETLTLEERGAFTTVKTVTTHKTLAAFDRHLSSGRLLTGLMERYSQLDDLLASLQKSTTPDVDSP